MHSIHGVAQVWGENAIGHVDLIQYQTEIINIKLKNRRLNENINNMKLVRTSSDEGW